MLGPSIRCPSLQTLVVTCTSAVLPLLEAHNIRAVTIRQHESKTTPIFLQNHAQIIKALTVIDFRVDRDNTPSSISTHLPTINQITFCNTSDTPAITLLYPSISSLHLLNTRRIGPLLANFRSVTHLDVDLIWFPFDLMPLCSVTHLALRPGLRCHFTANEMLVALRPFLSEAHQTVLFPGLLSLTIHFLNDLGPSDDFGSFGSHELFNFRALQNAIHSRNNSPACCTIDEVQLRKGHQPWTWPTLTAPGWQELQ